MKASYATWLTIGIFSLSWAAEETLAELPPGTYEMLKEEATEVLQIEVTGVNSVDENEIGQDPLQRFICTAKVTGIERSSGEVAIGDEINFETWTVKPHQRENFVGPAIPPEIPAGWRGKVYLNPPEQNSVVGENGSALGLAAYGRSFEAESKLLLKRRRLLPFRR